MPSTLAVTAEHKHGLNFEVDCRGHRFETDDPLAPEDTGVGLDGRTVQLLWDEQGEKICPVAAMLGPAVPITITCKVL